MRASVLGALWVVLLGCRCGPDQPTPVTVRVKNVGPEALFVDESRGALGVSLLRSGGGKWTPFVEEPECECLACDRVCAGCACDGGTPAPVVRRLASGGSVERSWRGVIHNGALSSCGRLLGGSACYRAENPTVDETLRARLCYALSAPGFYSLDGGDLAPGVLAEKSLVCVERDFRTADGVVELLPQRGSACLSHADCKGTDELCFDGACTTSCPTNAFPEVGAAWQIAVAEPDDQGFFAKRTQDTRTVYEGTGTLSSVLYQGPTMVLRLRRTGASGESLTAAVYVTLPPGFSVSLTAGTEVSVVVIDGSSASSRENRALVMRDRHASVVLAADSAWGGALLTAADLSPFAVAAGEPIVGCQHNDCGKRLYYPSVFSGPATPVAVAPGASSVQSVTDADAGTLGYRLLNGTRYAYARTHCSPTSLSPYAILRER